MRVVLPGPAWALPLLISSLTPPFLKRPEQQPPYQCHMVPRAGGSSHCQPHTSLGSSRTSGLLSPWRPASSSLPREPACQQPRALGLGVEGVGRNSLQHRGLAHSTEDYGELTDTDQCGSGAWAVLLSKAHCPCLVLCFWHICWILGFCTRFHGCLQGSCIWRGEGCHWSSTCAESSGITLAVR